MKKTLLFALLLVSSTLFGQTKELVLNIEHLLGQSPLTTSAIGTNNLGNQMKYSRLQYYIDDIQVEYNQDSVFEYPQVLLIDALNGNTKVNLGSIQADSISAIRFAIGVGPDLNNLDPSTYPAAHPLAPKNPSMHWGWTAGYRFVCAEGMGSSAFDQAFELHGLGNDNYALQTIPTSGVTGGGDTLHIILKADYSELVRNIGVAQGVISHGETGSAFQALKNFNNHVFTSSEGNAAMGDAELQLEKFEVSLYPNPTNGPVTIKAPQGAKLEVYNSVGNLVIQRKMQSAQGRMELKTPGMYLVKVSHQGSSSVQKIIVR